MMPLLFKRMIYLTLLSLLLSSCVQPPVFKAEDYALIKSNYPIVSVNGNEIEKTFKMDIEAGENTLVVVYNTYNYDYFCTFSWVAVAGTAYEITDQENQYPLTLYRWSRKNDLWAIRLDSVNPQKCDLKPKQ